MSADKEKEEFMHDWYAILSCDVDSTKEAIEKAARKLSIKYHPDKTSDPEAPEKFLLIQKAKEILTDDGKRRIIDEKIRATAKRKAYEAQRNSAMDARRKRMRSEFNDRLQKAATRQPTEAEVLKAELQKRSKIIEQLRKKNEDVMERSKQQAVDEETKKVDEFYRYRKAMASSAKQSSSKHSLAQCQIKVKWKRTAESHSDDSLYQLFKQFGQVEEAALVGSKGTSAIVTFSDAESAKNAIAHFADAEDMRVTSLAGNTESGSSAASTASSSLAADIKRALQKDNLMNIIGKTKSTMRPPENPATASEGVADSSSMSSIILREIDWDDDDPSRFNLTALEEREKFVFGRLKSLSSVTRVKQSAGSVNA